MMTTSPRRKVGTRNLVTPGQEADSVNRPVKHTGRDDAITPQTGYECQRFPMAVRHLGNQALTHRTATMQAGHVCLGPGLVNKDQPGRVHPALQALPYPTPPGNIVAVLFTGVQSFF